MKKKKNILVPKTSILLLLMVMVTVVSCKKEDRGYGPNDCRVCTAFYPSGLTASEPTTVCSESAEQNFRQEFNYADKIECKK